MRKVLYANLKVEMVRYGVSQNDIAKAIKIARPSVTNRLNGTVDWRLNEMKIVQKVLGNQPIDYLFG